MAGITFLTPVTRRAIALVLISLAACGAVKASAANLASNEPIANAGPVPDAEISGEITLLENSNICVTAHIDQAVWSSVLPEDMDRNFSNNLATQIEGRLSDRGFSVWLPGPERERRVSSFYNPANPMCRDLGKDIFVTVSILPKPDGRPLLVVYRIDQGAVVREGSVAHDVEGEWDAGTRQRAPYIPLSRAAIEELRASADLILQFIE